MLRIVHIPYMGEGPITTGPLELLLSSGPLQDVLKILTVQADTKTWFWAFGPHTN